MTRKQTQPWRFVLMMAVVSTAVPVLAQDEMPEMTPEMQAEMAVWRELAQPGEHHEHLTPFVGTWKGAVQMWMQPAGEPMINESLSTAS